MADEPKLTCPHAGPEPFRVGYYRETTPIDGPPGNHVIVGLHEPLLVHDKLEWACLRLEVDSNTLAGMAERAYRSPDGEYREGPLTVRVLGLYKDHPKDGRPTVRPGT